MLDVGYWSASCSGYGYIDRTGNIVIKPRFFSPAHLAIQGGAATAKLDFQPTAEVPDKIAKGKVKRFHNGVAVVVQNFGGSNTLGGDVYGLLGYIESSGKVLWEKDF